MSGLFGVVDFAASRIEPENFRSIVESASYRAPGGIGYRFLGEAGFAHLALHSGPTGLDQPLLDARGQVCVILDGRLDNRPELIAHLEPAQGSATSDAGLLLAAYLEWGVACTDHLLGDFAFAVWDAGRQRLLCAVDPLGIKPLHYAHIGSLVCFASDAVQVLQHPAVPDGNNEVEIAAYLASQCEDPECSFFAAIRKLAPGQRLIAERGQLHVERYWSPEPKEIRYQRDEDYAAHFLEIFQRAVADRLRDAGSFVGVAMSGGLDSTSVAALAQRAPGPGVRAYTFSFDRLTECDERAYSQAMTEELGIEVEAVEAEGLWSLDSRGPLSHSPDTPFVGWHTCYREILHRMAGRGARVLLMGHGGDDLLRGSSWVYAERLRRGDLTAIQEVVLHARRRREPVLRSLHRQFGSRHLSERSNRFLHRVLGKREPLLPSWLHPDFVRRTQRGNCKEGLSSRRFSASPGRQEVYGNLVELPWYWRLANWHDRNAASFGIEVRQPFLDRRLFEYVLAIPGEQLFQLGSRKRLLRQSMAGILPEVIRSRSDKTKFTSFLDFALRQRATDEIMEILESPRSAEVEIVNKELLRSAFLGFLGGDASVSMKSLWHAITLEIWLRRCKTIGISGRQQASPVFSLPVA